MDAEEEENRMQNGIEYPEKDPSGLENPGFDSDQGYRDPPTYYDQHIGSRL